MSKKSSKITEDTFNWCFAIINGKLGQIFFKKGSRSVEGIFGHSYHSKKDIFSAEEKKMIGSDIKKHQFSFRKGKYNRVNVPV